MISIVLYEHSKDFYQLDYSQLDKSKRSDFSHDSTADAHEVLFITPSPFHADTLRSKLTNVASAGMGRSYDVITMSKYLKDQLIELIDEEVLKQFKGKSELMLYLSTAWKKVTQDYDIGLFRKAFNLLTDLRSFSLSLQVIETALEGYDEETQRAVSSFHQVMQLQGIIDEHQANYLLSERLRKGELPPNYAVNKVLVFWGFDFLSAVQVDLLKSLAIRNDVIVPIVNSVFEKSQTSDWIQWLCDHDSEVISLPHSDSPIKATIKEFPCNYLSKVLGQELRQHIETDIYIGTKNLEAVHAQEVNLNNHFFKVPFNLFADNLANLMNELQEKLRNEDQGIKTTELLIWLTSKQDKYLAAKKFRQLKIVLQFKQNIIEWLALSDENDTFRLFDCYIFEEVMLLDLPRVSLIPYGHQHSGKIASLKELASLNLNKKNILCITSQYGPVKSTGGQYSEQVEKYLISIGPIRRSELEFEMLKHRLKELLQLESTTVLIEHGLIEHDIGWNSILGGCQSNTQQADIIHVSPIESEIVERVSVDHKRELKSISATRIQNYLDCPRKYFFNYVSNLSPRVQIPGVLDLLKMGEIEHAVIENYLNTYSEFNEDSLSAVIVKSMDKVIEENQLIISDKTKDMHAIEVRSLCTLVIKNLLQINDVLGLNLSFEHDIVIEGRPRVTGSIDLLATNQDMQFVLDFKRSGGSIPSASKLIEFEKIQLWFYMQRLKELGILDLEKKIVFGYVNLSRPEESLILTNNETTRSILIGSSLEVFGKVSMLKQDLATLLKDYETFEQEILAKIQGDSEYRPNPITAKVCTYCAISNVCQRGEFREVKSDE